MNQSLLRRHHVEIFLLALLLVVFCGRIWDLGITTTDDAMWALWVHQPNQLPVMDFAVHQGRFWVLGNGAWLRYGLFYANTTYGDVLIVASFLLFFALFLRAVSVYWSASTAYLTGGIFLAIFALRADRSILTAYPLFFWMPASAIIGGLLAARRYQHCGGLAWLGLGALLLLVGMFNNEGATALTLLIVPLAVWANHRQCPPTDGPASLRTRRAAVASALVLLGFVAATAWWRLAHPSSYAGTTLAPFDAFRILDTLFNFSFSGIVFFDFVHPYAQNYADALTQSGNHVVYNPARFIAAALGDETSVIVGGAVLLLLLRTLLCQTDPGNVRVPPRSALIGCIVGLAIALVLLLPVAMTSQYQNWFYQYDSHAYSHTIFASFGVALILAQLSELLVGSQHLSRPFQIIGAAGLAIILGFTAMVGNRMNDAIAHDMRPEAARWRVLKDLVAIAKATGTEHVVYYAPRFHSGSWFAIVPSAYWSQYARSVYNSPLRITDEGLSAGDIASGAGYADYQPSDDGRSLLITALHLAPAPDDGAFADRITIMIDGALEPASMDAVLSFQDRRRGFQQLMLRNLHQIEHGVWTIHGIEAEAGSVRIAGQSALPRLRIGCGDQLAAGQVMQFGQDMTGPGCYAAAYLKSGWAPSEATGTWATGPVATLQIPTTKLPPSDMDLVVDASSYSGLGFSDLPQMVRVAINGRAVASWRFGALTPSPVAPIAIHAADWQTGTPLNITFATDPLLNPKQLGKADDTRNLGLMLRSIVIRPKPE